MSGRIVRRRERAVGSGVALQMAADPKKPRMPVGRLSRADLMALGKVLDFGPGTGQLASEPIPDRFLELLRKLDEPKGDPPD
jgi:hypothetical protein